MPPPLLLDPATIDFDRVVVDQQGIRQVNPHRDEMEQLSAILILDTEKHIAVGYKDVTEHEFWVPSHMPGFPIMPGVLMCEAAAQLASYYCVTQNLLGGEFIGFGGMEAIRFRGLVRPGQRLLIVAQLGQLRPKRRAVFAFQGFVGATMVVDGKIVGVPLRPGEAGSAPAG